MESRVAIAVGDEQVSGLLLRPAEAKALYLFAHGAGVGNVPARSGRTSAQAEGEALDAMAACMLAQLS
jgi:hypothetical protein